MKPVASAMLAWVVAFGMTLACAASFVSSQPPRDSQSGRKSPARAVSETSVALIVAPWQPPTGKISPDTRRVVYLAPSRAVVIDGKEGKRYEDFMRLRNGIAMFSPNGRRVAYVGIVGGKYFVVVDGRESKPYAGIITDSVVFCPDSSRVAFVADVGGKGVVVIDGQEQKPYDGIMTTWLSVPKASFQEKPHDLITFSPDSRRFAYVARAGTQLFVVVDGAEQGRYDLVISPRFSPDSRRIAYAAK